MRWDDGVALKLKDHRLKPDGVQSGLVLVIVVKLKYLRLKPGGVEVGSTSFPRRPRQTPHHLLCGGELGQWLVVSESNLLHGARHAFAPSIREYRACPASVAKNGLRV